MGANVAKGSESTESKVPEELRGANTSPSSPRAVWRLLVMSSVLARSLSSLAELVIVMAPPPTRPCWSMWILAEFVLLVKVADKLVPIIGRVTPPGEKWISVLKQKIF